MASGRLPETVQTLYAELLEHSIHADAAEAAIGVPPGSFVRRKVKGRTYWYLQRQEGERKRQYYVGAESDALLSWIEKVRETRHDQSSEVRTCCPGYSGLALQASLHYSSG